MAPSRSSLGRWCLRKADRAAARFGGLAGAAVRFSGGTHALAGSPRFAGPATIELTGGTLESNATVTLDSAAGTAVYRVSGGTLNGTTSLWQGNGGRIEWTGGTFGGTQSLDPGVTLAISGPATKTLDLGAGIRNSGTMTWEGPGMIFNDSDYGRTPAVIEILPGGLLDLLSDGLVFDQSFFHSGGFSELRNAAGGRIRKSGGAGPANFNDFLVVNDGVIEVAAGAIETNRLARLRHGGAIQGAGELVVPSGSVEVAGSTALQGGTLHIQGGYLWGDPSSAPAAGFTATGQGRVRWTQGWLGGTVALAAGTLMEISGAGGKEMDVAARLHNHGTLTWSGAEVYHNSDGRAFAAIHNEAGGNLVLQSGGAFLTQSFFRSGGVSAFHNEAGATFTVAAGAGSEATCGWRFHNHGTVTVESGTLVLSEGGSSSGEFGGLAGAAVRFSGGTHALAGSPRFAGPATIELTGGTLESNATVTLDSAAGTAVCRVSGGTLGGTGLWQTNGGGRIEWTGGTFGGTQSLDPGVTLAISGPATKTLDLGAGIRNSGTMTWEGPGVIFNDSDYGAHQR
jgi:hypothetical protein